MALQADLVLNTTGYDVALQKSATKAVSTLGAAGTQGGASFAKGMEKGIGRGKESIAQLGAAISVLDPQIGAVVTQAGALSGALKAGATALSSLGGAGLAVGALAAVVGTGVLMWKEYGYAAKESAQALADIEDRSVKAGKALAAFEAQASGKRLKEAIGIATQAARAGFEEFETGLNALKARQEAESTYADAYEKARARQIAADKQLVELRARLADPDTGMTGIIDTTSAIKEAEKEYAKATDEVEGLNIATNNLSDFLWKEAEAQAEKETTKATKERKAATDEMSEALKRQQEEERKLAAIAREAAEQRAAASDELATLTEAAYQASLDPQARLIRQQELELANLDAVVQQVSDREAAVKAYGLVEQRQAAERKALRDQEDADKQAKDDRELARLRQQRDLRISYGLDVLSSVQQLAQDEVDAHGKSAKGAVFLSKAAATSQIMISGAVAAMKAYADLGPVFGIPAAIAMGITTAIQAAKVASAPIPAYASGFVPPQRQGERLGYIGDGEAIVNPRGVRALGTDTIREANRGRARPSSTVVNLDGATLATVTTRRIRSSSSLSEETNRIASRGRIGLVGRGEY